MKYIAIMAGGVGSRFWPSSRESLPKQFLDIMDTGRSLIQSTFQRCLKLVPAEHILIVTNERYKDLVIEHLPALPPENILCEPSRNNTAPCVCYTALRIKSMSKNGVMAVLPSDHIIEKEDVFVSALNKAFDFALKNDALVTLGIEPTRPDTGYGYIEMEEATMGQSSSIRKVRAFKEKPDLPTAQSYLATGKYVWNAGIFVWSTEAILKSFQNNASQILEVLSREEDKYGTRDEQAYINEVYPRTENISVDYAILERADNVYTLPVEFGWSDLGTWASLHDKVEKDKDGNRLLGMGELLDCENVLVKSGPKKLIVAKDLKDFIVIDEDDVLLIWPKEKEQDIKALRKRLEEEGRDEYL